MLDYNTKVAMLQRAIDGEQQITIMYWAKKDGKVTSKDIVPRSIRKDKWGRAEFVYATYASKDQLRMFDIGRILNISIKEDAKRHTATQQQY